MLDVSIGSSGAWDESAGPDMPLQLVFTNVHIIMFTIMVVSIVIQMHLRLIGWRLLFSKLQQTPLQQGQLR